MLVRSFRSVSMSRTWGMFSRMTSSSVRMAAAMHGNAEFFAPETLMVPRRGLPPRTTNLSIPAVYERVTRKAGAKGDTFRQNRTPARLGALNALRSRRALLHTATANGFQLFHLVRRQHIRHFHARTP